MPIADSASEEKFLASTSVYSAAVAVESCTYTGPNIRVNHYWFGFEKSDGFYMHVIDWHVTEVVLCMRS